MSTKYNRQELLTNAFLVQLTYGICCGIILLLISKGFSNTATITSMPALLIFMSVAAAVYAVIYLFVWQKNPVGQRKIKYRDRFLYGIAFSLGAVYIQLFHKIDDVLNALFGLAKNERFFTQMHGITSMFYILALYIIIAFVAYIIRYNQKPGGKHGNNRNKKRN